MTTIKRVPAKNPKGAGRKPLPVEVRKLKRTVSLSPEVVADLVDAGNGVLSKGIEMRVRDVVVSNDQGEVVGVVHFGPGVRPYQAWSRTRFRDGHPGNSHDFLGLFDSVDEATAAVRSGKKKPK